jgi:hypothetical protein
VNKKVLIFINIVLVIGLVLLMVIVRQTARKVSVKELPSTSQAAIPRKITPSVTIPQRGVYDINAAKTRVSGAGKEMTDLAEVYQTFPREDAGDNITANWARMKPEDKARFKEEFDKNILQAKETLKTNPQDRRAKALLIIASSLRNMADNDFNMKLNSQNSATKEKEKVELPKK